MIRIGVPAFCRHRKPLVSIGANQDHVSLYVMYGSVLRNHAATLGPYDTSSTAVRFNSAHPIPIRLVIELVTARAAEIDHG